MYSLELTGWRGAREAQRSPVVMQLSRWFFLENSSSPVAIWLGLALTPAFPGFGSLGSVRLHPSALDPNSGPVSLSEPALWLFLWSGMGVEAGVFGDNVGLWGKAINAHPGESSEPVEVTRGVGPYSSRCEKSR
jgi:hypothetical protein